MLATSDFCGFVLQGHMQGLSPLRAESLHIAELCREGHPGQPKARREEVARKTNVDPRPWRSPPRSGRKSPSRRKTASPGRRKSPRRKKSSGSGSGGGGGGTPAPHTPISYRDVTVMSMAATSAGGLMSHQAVPSGSGLTLVEAVRQGAAQTLPGQVVDPASHAAAIAGNSAEVFAALSIEQTEALEGQRTNLVAEIALLETILRERRRDLQAVDETLAGMHPRRTRGPRKPRKSDTSPSRTKSPKR